MGKQTSDSIGKFIPLSLFFFFFFVFRAEYDFLLFNYKARFHSIIVPLMDLSKVFDTINHELLAAKLYAHGFPIETLEFY